MNAVLSTISDLQSFSFFTEEKIKNLHKTAVKRMRVNLLQFLLQRRDPVQMVPDEQLDLGIRAPPVKTAQEFKLHDQMIRNRRERLSHLQSELTVNVQEMNGRIPHQETLLCGERKGTSGILYPGFVARFNQGNAFSPSSRKEAIVFVSHLSCQGIGLPFQDQSRQGPVVSPAGMDRLLKK
jgi:hypothetical protein